MYNTTAFLYEAIAGCKRPRQVCKEMHDILGRAGLQPPGLLGDLGAGTGLMGILLAELGWNVYGVELSPAMTAVAREKSTALPADLQARLTWTQGDITSFEMPPGMLLDGVVCLHNTINHLVEGPQVEAFFRAAFRALKPNGLLLLDSDTQTMFTDYFNHGPTVVWDDGAHRVTRACVFDSQTGRAHHTATLENYTPQGLRHIGKDTLALQYHPEPELFAALSAAGFTLQALEPYNPNPDFFEGDFIPKALWLLRKPT